MGSGLYLELCIFFLIYLTVQDLVYMDEMSHFDRERIPERVVHAKGAGEFALWGGVVHCPLTY